MVLTYLALRKSSFRATLLAQLAQFTNIRA